MARKSAQLRLSESETLLALYIEACLEEDYRARFIRDMTLRLQRNKSLSKKQRDWLDSLIEEGIPEPLGDQDLIARIETAQRVEGMNPYSVRILSDFLSKIKRGWSLSEKQTAWMNGILEEADKIAHHGPYSPDEETIETLKTCVRLSLGYSSVYWETHGGTKKAFGNVKNWLEEGGFIDEWSVKKLIKAMSSRLRELRSTPYVNPGDLVWCRFAHTPGGNPALGVVSGGPSVSGYGTIVYSILVDGKVEELTKDRLAKRVNRT